MSYGIINQQHLTNIANAIRNKLGVQTTYTPSEMPDAIASISGGGITPTGTKIITVNGTYDVVNYASANVSVPTGSTAVLGAKTITANGTYNAGDDSLDGYNQVTVNVSGGGGSSWLPASAELVASVDETLNLSADTSWDSITPSTTQQAILPNGAVRGACSYTLTTEQTENKAVIAVASAKIIPAYTSLPDNAYSLSFEAFSIGNYCMFDLSNWEDNGITTNMTVAREVYMNASGVKSCKDGSIYYGIILNPPQFVGTGPSSKTPTLGFTRQAINARCDTNIFSTDSAALIDSANTNIVFKYRIYLIDKADSTLYACFDANNGTIK